MSELTQCNYCSLRRIKADAKKAGNKVTLMFGWRGGTDVFVHPKTVKIERGAGEKGHEQHRYFRAWFMELGSSCGC